ncbi:hypothetical protein BAE44_0006328 [Dichanthelium oligosanthes]|uniref:Uncharacterized protein n=1 Tax=Dichanthelium oligosanthes TaxID=888268 RepID=A0A1E5W5G5_9POAL|nr:hypothetical protein BAE44_0006328 [Dichanthelium oligosanthes]
MVRAGVEGKTRSGGEGSPACPPLPARRRRGPGPLLRPAGERRKARSMVEVGSRAGGRSRGGARRWPGRSAVGCLPPQCLVGVVAVIAAFSRWFRRPAGGGRAGGRARRPMPMP